MKGLHPEGNNSFFKQMAVACSIFTLGGGGVQLFWAAFDMPVTVVPLKVALGLEKIDFWAFKKNNHDVSPDIHLCNYFFEMAKNIFLYTNASFNGTTVTGISKAAENN